MNYDVCYVTSHYANPMAEGVNQASVRIINSARRSGLKVSVISFEPVGSSNVEEAFVKVIPTLFHRALPGARSLRKLAYRFNIEAILNSCFLPFVPECDIVHVIPPLPTIFYSAILRLLYSFKLRGEKPKVVAHIFHSFHPVMENFIWGGGETFWRQNLWLLKHRTFDRVFCVNKYLKNFVMQFVSDEIVQYVPYPVDTDIFKPIKNKNAIRKKLGLPTDKFIIGYVGQVFPKRGILTLLEAFDIVADSHPNTSLVIASYVLNPKHPTRYAQFFFNHLKQIEANKKIIILNQLFERVELFYQAMDIMVLPFTQPYSIVDPPLVIMEALASGVPLITTPVGAIREVTYDKANALHVPPGDAKVLSERIISLASDAELCSRLGEQARKTAIKYSFEVVGTLLGETYEGILT